MPPTVETPERFWLRSAPFDLLFIVGVAALALTVGVLLEAGAVNFFLVLSVNLWLLGYHHVISTYTRLCFDAESFARHRFLVLGLPWIVLGGTWLLAVTWELRAVATLYFYWQWFHYTRQSYGVARIYARRAGDLLAAHQRWDTALLYMVPLWGVLHRSHSQGGRELFLNMRVWFLDVPGWLVHLAGLASALLLGRWVWTRVGAWRRGQLALAPELYMLSHLVVFTVGYVGFESIDNGWMTINIWHNAQYILVVWMYNANRFKGGVSPEHRALSWLSQARPLQVLSYFGVCLILTSAFYGLAAFGAEQVTIGDGVSVGAVVLYMTINFHHYVVDGVIWKVRKDAVYRNLRS